MGRLAGFKYKEIVKKLKELGLVFHRDAKGSHEIWFHKGSGLFTTIPKHSGDVPEGTLKAVLKQVNIDTEDFLNA